MTKMEVIMYFNCENVTEEKSDANNRFLMEKIYNCTEDEFLEMSSISCRKGYYDGEIYTFCNGANNKDELGKAFAWISENSENLKVLRTEFGVSLSLIIEFSVEPDTKEESVNRKFAKIFGLSWGPALRPVISYKDLKLLSENEISLDLTAGNFIELDDEDEDEDL